MLESYIGVTIDQLVEYWKGKGSPKIPLSQGISIPDLERYFSLQKLSLGALGAISDWYSINLGINQGCEQ